MSRAELAALLVQSGLSELDAAVCFVRFSIRFEGGAVARLADVAGFFEAQSISRPNKSRLGKKLDGDRRLIKADGGYKVRKAAELAVDKMMNLPSSEKIISQHTEALVQHAAKIQDEQTKSFVFEAIECMRSGCLRAAVLLSWAGAMAILQMYVFKNHLANFNADAVSNGLLKKAAENITDIRGVSKESQFIEVLARISILDDGMKRGLKRCLDRRNDCAHPSNLKIGEAFVADHIETLIMNVFEPFSADDLERGAA